jgi:hypothetical protein
VVLWFGAVILAIVRASDSRPPRLKSISPQSHDRFALAWDAIATEFVHAPAQATRDAEALVYNLLAARGHARQWIARERQEGTEALHQAMLHYHHVLDQVIGRREMA